jgi:CcmD family protein
MGAFVAAYLVVWMAVVMYVLRLGARQRRLRRAIEALELHCEQSQPRGEPTSTAA